MALAIKGRFIGIQSTGNVLCQHALHIRFQFFCIRMRGQRMQIGHHKITGVFILHTHEVAQGTKVVAQVQKSGRPDTAHHYLILLCHRAAKITINRESELPTLCYICFMEVNDALVDKLAHLARLSFDGQEKEGIKQDLQKMITFVEKLNELDLENVEPLIHMSPEVNVLRNDAVSGSVSREEALKNAPKTDGEFFLVPKVIKR